MFDVEERNLLVFVLVVSFRVLFFFVTLLSLAVVLSHVSPPIRLLLCGVQMFVSFLMNSLISSFPSFYWSSLISSCLEQQGFQSPAILAIFSHHGLRCATHVMKRDTTT